MRHFLPLLLLLTGYCTLSAQTPTRQLSGKVLNEKNEPLTGVNILVQPGSKRIMTDAEGRYIIQLDPTAQYILTLSFVGFETKSVAGVELQRSQENVLDIVMKESARSTLESVTIRSTPRRQENTNALLAFQKGNAAVSSGLAADFIRRTPDKNTGEVLRRVSGASIQDNKYVIIRGLADRYNAALINGAVLPSSEPDKKAFSFDVIPSALIDNIIISKTATPDLSGEFAGGVVQINTRDIPASNLLSVGFSLGFNTRSAFKNFLSNERGSTDFLGFSNNRGLPDAYPRRYLDYSRLSETDKTAVTRSFSDDVYRKVQSRALPVQTWNLTWANVHRYSNGSALGTVIGITYRQSKLLYDNQKTLYEKGESGQAFFDYSDQQHKYGVTWGGVANIAWSYKKHKIAFKNLFNQLLEDNYYTRTGINTENLQDVQMRSSVLNQRSLYSAQLEGTHQVTSRNIRLQWNLNFAFNHKSQPDLRVQTYGKTLGVNEPYRINLRGNNTNRFFSGLRDYIFGYNASATLPFEIHKRKQSLKLGGSSTIRLRDFKAYIFGYTEPSDPSLLTLPYDQIFRHSNMGGNGFLLSTDLQNIQDKYYGISALSAGYLMFDNKIGESVRLVWGTRVEYFEQFLKSNTPGTEKALVINTDKLDFLPSANFTWSPNAQTNLRLAASRTVARPEFREVAPFTFFDFEQIASTQGNASLRRSSILNGDIRYEFYPAAGELLSAGAFYKKFTDPIELRLNSASVATRRQYQFQNAEQATLYGVELEFRKQLSFLSNQTPWLSNLYFNGNFSLIFSEVLLGNRDADGNKLPATKRPLQGQSPYLLNAGFQYDAKSGTGFSVLYNRIGERLVLVGNDDFGDIYEKPRNLVDLQVTRKVLKSKGELRLTVSDLFNQPFASFENRDGKKSYDARTDRQFSSFRPGTTFTLAFQYNLN